MNLPQESQRTPQRPSKHNSVLAASAAACHVNRPIISSMYMASAPVKRLKIHRKTQCYTKVMNRIFRQRAALELFNFIHTLILGATWRLLHISAFGTHMHITINDALRLNVRRHPRSHDRFDRSIRI